MIIIKTSNGDRFINEAETLQVSHIKKDSEVNVWIKTNGEARKFITIRNVESVIFTTQETKYVSEGSEIERLQKKLDEHLKWGSEIRAKYMELDKENDQMKGELEKLRNLVKTMEGMNQEPTPK